MKQRGIFRAQSRGEGVRTIYAILRSVLRFFALFIVFVTGVVVWRKWSAEEVTQGSFEFGEVVTLGTLLLVALALWLFAWKVGREIDKT